MNTILTYLAPALADLIRAQTNTIVNPTDIQNVRGFGHVILDSAYEPIAHHGYVVTVNGDDIVLDDVDLDDLLA